MPPRKRIIIEEEGDQKHAALPAPVEGAAGLPPLTVVAAASASEAKLAPKIRARASPPRGMDEKCRSFVHTFRRAPDRSAAEEAKGLAAITRITDLYLKEQGFWPSVAQFNSLMGKHIGVQGYDSKAAREIAEKAADESVNDIVNAGEDLLKEFALALKARRTKETEQVEKYFKSPTQAMEIVAKQKFELTGQEEVEVRTKAQVAKEEKKGSSPLREKEKAVPSEAKNKKHKRSPSPKAEAKAKKGKDEKSPSPKAKKVKKEKSPSPKAKKKKGGVSKTTIQEAIDEWRDKFDAYFDVLYAESQKAKIRAAIAKIDDEKTKKALEAKVEAIDKRLAESKNPYIAEGKARYKRAIANHGRIVHEELDEGKSRYKRAVANNTLSVNQWDQAIRFIETYYRLWQINQKIEEEDHIRVLFGHDGETEEERERHFRATHKGESEAKIALLKLKEQEEIENRTLIFTSAADADNELFRCFGLFRENLTPDQFEEAVNKLAAVALEDYDETRLDRAEQGTIQPSAREFVQRGLLMALDRIQADLALEQEEEIADTHEDIEGTREGCKARDIAGILEKPLSEERFLEVLAQIPKQAYLLAAGPRVADAKFSDWSKEAGYFGEDHVRNDLAKPPSSKVQQSPVLKEYFEKASIALDSESPILKPAQREKVNNDQNKIFLQVADIRLPEHTSLLPQALQKGKIKKRIEGAAERRKGKLGALGFVSTRDEDLEFVGKVEDLRGLALEEAEVILRGAGRIRVKAVSWMLRCGDPRAVEIFLIQVADALREAALAFHVIDKPGDITALEDAKRYLDKAAKTFIRTKNANATKWEDVARTRLAIKVQLENAARKVAEGKATAAEAYEFAAEQVAKYASTRGRPANVIQLRDKKGKGKEKEEEEDVVTPYKRWGLDIPAAWALDAARDIQKENLTVDVKERKVPVKVTGPEAEQFWNSLIRHRYLPKELERAALAVRANQAKGMGEDTAETLEPLALYLYKHHEWGSILPDVLENDYLQLGDEFNRFRLTSKQVKKAREFGDEALRNLKAIYPEAAKRKEAEEKAIRAKREISAKELRKWERDEYKHMLTAKERRQLGLKKSDLLRKGQTEAAQYEAKHGKSQYLDIEAAEREDELTTAAAAGPGQMLQFDLDEEEEEADEEYQDEEAEIAAEDEIERIQEQARIQAEKDEEEQRKRASAERRKLAVKKPKRER